MWGRTTDTLHATALASHIVCCGAPIALNMVALVFGAGLLGAAAPWVDATHVALHSKEALLLTISASLVALGGFAQYMSWRQDCGREACGHGSCTPKKPRRLWVFALVCTLFTVNLALFVAHRTLGGASEMAALADPVFLTSVS